MNEADNPQSLIKQSFERIAKALTRKPSLGRTTYKSTTRLGKGLTCEIQESGWRIEADMPSEAGGRGEGPTPGMLGRAALGSCLTVGYMLWASRLDVPVSSLEIEIETDSDDAGLFGTSDAAPGYSQVRYCVTVESTASEAAVVAMLNEAERHSPWLDVFSRPMDCRRQLRLHCADGQFL